MKAICKTRIIVNAALIIATSPICAALIGTVIGVEKVTRFGALGIVTAFTGVVVIITNGQTSELFQSGTLMGNMLLLLNAIVWAGFTIYGKTILKKYSPFTAMAYIHIFGTLLLLPFAFFPGPLTPIPLLDQLYSISRSTIFSALYLALLCSIYAYYIWYIGVEKFGAVRTAAFAYFNPLFAIIAGIALLNEPVTAFTIGGGILIISGVYLSNRSAALKQAD